jgi:hypothetical protein
MLTRWRLGMVWTKAVADRISVQMGLMPVIDTDSIRHNQRRRSTLAVLMAALWCFYSVGSSWPGVAARVASPQHARAVSVRTAPPGFYRCPICGMLLRVGAACPCSCCPGDAPKSVPSVRCACTVGFGLPPALGSGPVLPLALLPDTPAPAPLPRSIACIVAACIDGPPLSSVSPPTPPPLFA